MAKKKLEVTVVYTKRGSAGLENQTRYNTSDIMDILNYVEEAAFDSGRMSENEGRFGAVIALTDSRKPVFMRERYHWNGHERVVEPYPSWVQDGTWQAWNVVQVTPPEMLYTNALQALTWDGVTAPEELGDLLERRFSDGVLYSVQLDSDTKRRWPIRVEAERQSKRRAPDQKPYLQSVLSQMIQRNERHVAEASWALARTRGMDNVTTQIKMRNLGATAEFEKLQQLASELQTHMDGIILARRKMDEIAKGLVKYAIPNRSK
jgi:hypothetical protein